jgi:hypothetical protein
LDSWPLKNGPLLLFWILDPWRWYREVFILGFLTPEEWTDRFYFGFLTPEEWTDRFYFWFLTP